jgi:hypothetical protein
MVRKHAEAYLAKVREGEPVFILRGQDKLAPEAIVLWAQKALMAGSPPAKVVEAIQCAQAMMEWQERHGSKVPD